MHWLQRVTFIPNVPARMAIEVVRMVRLALELDVTLVYYGAVHVAKPMIVNSRSKGSKTHSIQTQ